MALVGILLAAASATGIAGCTTYVGQRVETSTFAEVRAALPVVAARDPYESSVDYARRLNSSSQPDQRSFILRRVPEYREEGLAYDPDRKTLTVYKTAFGAGRINFQEVMGGPLRRGEDNFASAIGFTISATETGQETYEANNAFGARATVTRTNRQIDAIWERIGKLGEDPFVGMRSGRVAVIPMEPDMARELIERGSTALLFSPGAPYHASGTSTLPPSFNRPRERQDNIDVLIGDVRCGFLLDSQDTVIHAFTVK